MNRNIQDYILTLKKDLQINEVENTTLYFQNSQYSYAFRNIPMGIRKMISILSDSGASEDDLYEIVLDIDDTKSSVFFYYLQRLTDLGFICHSIRDGSETMATYVPFSCGQSIRQIPLEPGNRYILSRFAYTRREGRQTVLESPLAPGRIVLAHWQCSAVVNLLADSCNFQQILKQVPGIKDYVLQQLLTLLAHAGMLNKVHADGSFQEDTDEATRQWEFHDLLFHARSRMGRHDQRVEGTYRFQDQIEPLPAIKPPMPGERTALFVPDLEKLKEKDYPFTMVMEERQSVREYDDQELTSKQLGEFLYRCARTKSLQKADPDNGHLYDASRRPYPGGGACHELELYLAVNRCRGLEPGLYHYASFSHELEKLSELTRDVKSLSTACARYAAIKDLPPVSIHIAARFQRLSWKYQTFAYSVILKDVGVLYQTMYLVATAMDLAACGIGAGDSDLLCRAAGLNYLEESPVGEFILGRKRI